MKSMSSKWFICQNEHVSGPFSTEQVQNKVQSAEVMATDMIWGRGMPGWQNVRWWSQELPSMNADTYVEPAPEQWHYALGGASHGPYNRASLLAELRHVHSQLGEVMLWTKGMKEWAHLFEFHDILTDLGVNKRQFPRAEVQGKCMIKADGLTLIAPMLSISEGGMGVQLESGLVAGQEVTVEIQSPQFRDMIHAKATVRYVANGVAGLKFTNINSENKGAIIQFVRQTTTRFVLKAA